MNEFLSIFKRKMPDFGAHEYLTLADDGDARLLFLFLLIHPHEGSFHVPGLSRYTAGVLAHE